MDRDVARTSCLCIFVIHLSTQTFQKLAGAHGLVCTRNPLFVRWAWLSIWCVLLALAHAHQKHKIKQEPAYSSCPQPTGIHCRELLRVERVVYYTVDARWLSLCLAIEHCPLLGFHPAHSLIVRRMLHKCYENAAQVNRSLHPLIEANQNWIKGRVGNSCGIKMKGYQVNVYKKCLANLPQLQSQHRGVFKALTGPAFHVEDMCQ